MIRITFENFQKIVPVEKNSFENYSNIERVMRSCNVRYKKNDRNWSIKLKKFDSFLKEKLVISSSVVQKVFKNLKAFFKGFF